MHEVDPVYMGVEPRWEEVRAWRKAKRERLIATRRAIPSAERERKTQLMIKHLEGVLGSELSGKSISVFWPFLGEPDLRDWMATVSTRGARCLLPVVTKRDMPLRFRTWTAGAPVTRGVLNIPVPAAGEERHPDIVIAPVVGFDPKCFRLGIGGGYFDRTLAELEPAPVAIGIGFAFQEVATIHPQDHDIPMDYIVTDEGVRDRLADDRLTNRAW